VPAGAHRARQRRSRARRWLLLAGALLLLLTGVVELGGFAWALDHFS
jgi:hypothetical protein